MNTLTTKAAIFASLMAVSAFTSTAKAEQLVSLETAIDMLVTQQSTAVFNQVTQSVAYSIEQEVANFKIDSIFASDKGIPTTTISETAMLDSEQVKDQQETAK